MESIIIVDGKARRPIITDMLKLLTPTNSGLIKAFAGKLNKVYAPSHVDSVTREALKYSLKQQDHGIDSVLRSTNKDIAMYCHAIESVSDVVKGHRIGYLRIFLKFLNTERGLSPSLEMTANVFMYDRVVFIDELSQKKRQAFIIAAKSCKAEAIACDLYWSYVCELCSILKESSYSFTVEKVYSRAWRCLYVFMCANNLDYTPGLASLWIKETIVPSLIDWHSYRRAFAIFDHYAAHGIFEPENIYCRKGRDASSLPSWCANPLFEYLSVKEREGQAANSIRMQSTCNLRFLDFLIQSGVADWSELTPQIIVDFHVQDYHATSASKTAYTSRIRQFLDFLAQKDLVPDTFQLALPTSSASEVSIIKTLSNDELVLIENYKKHAESPIELRSICMVLLGLRLGLRGFDIVNIRLDDVDWARQEILVRQSKTASELILPIPTEVANCLYRYIVHGRPNVTTRSIFIRHHAPYCQLKRSACGAALARVLGRDDANTTGFHITRKTFASRMLASAVPADTIADALGHTTILTVNKYLSTDETGMRRCAIPLAAIPLYREVGH